MAEGSYGFHVERCARCADAARNGSASDDFRWLHDAEGTPRLCRAEGHTLVRVALLRADVNTTLRETLLDHRVDVHERLHVEPLDSLGDELSEPAALTEHRLTREPHECAEPQVARLAHVAKQLGDRWMGQ